MLYARMRQLHIEPPTRGRLTTLIQNALHDYEAKIYQKTSAQLSDKVKANLRNLIYKKEVALEKEEEAEMQLMLHDLNEVATNDPDAQEVSILSLHLLQACVVYINTLMVQTVLEDDEWKKRMTDADWRGLTPLFYTHINPYGSFNLDMESRLDLN
jgi:hypothetical protein